MSGERQWPKSSMGPTVLKGLDDVARIEGTCARRGCRITPENDSGWWAFVDGGRCVQQTCKECDAKSGAVGPKEE